MLFARGRERENDGELGTAELGGVRHVRTAAALLVKVRGFEHEHTEAERDRGELGCRRVPHERFAGGMTLEQRDRAERGGEASREHDGIAELDGWNAHGVTV